MEGYGGSIPPWVSEWMADVREHGVTSPCPSSAEQAEQFKAMREAEREKRREQHRALQQEIEDAKARVEWMRRAAKARVEGALASLEYHIDPSLRDPKFREILQDVAKATRVRADELMGPSRRPVIAHARQEVMYLCRALTQHSYGVIGRLLSRDHTTILYGVHAYCKRNKIPHPDEKRGASDD